MTSKILKYRLPCPQINCRSSDAYHIFQDTETGRVHGYCFSCGGYVKNPEVESGETSGFLSSSSLTVKQKGNYQFMTSDNSYTYQYLPWRGISKATMEAYNVLTKVDSEGKPVAISFPYGPNASKVREIEKKNFHSLGDMKNARLFGRDKFSSGSSKYITITEGELDALSLYQALGSNYPVLSVRSSSSAELDCSSERDYLNSFERIYLCFDADEPGSKAKERVARLFDFNKIYDVKLSNFKDANGYVEAGREADLKRIWWNSKRFLPEEIISSYQDFDKLIEEDVKKDSVTYPFPTVEGMTYGIRTGEVVLITALEGIGKTEVIRAIEYHLLKSTDSNIGLIHLEEDKVRNLKGLAGYEMQTPVHLPDTNVSKEDIKSAIRSITKRDDRLHIYNHFGSDDPSIILDIIRFLVTSCNCKYIFFDHITMAISGLGEEDERKALDFISTRLAMMVKELDFSLFLVSHVNDEGKTRGSRNISKIADCWIHLERDLKATTEEQRNITYLQFNKNRFGARTGPGGRLKFDLKTFMISEENTPTTDLPPLETL